MTKREAEECEMTPAQYEAEKRDYEATRARAARALLHGIKLSKAQTAKVVARYEALLMDKYGMCLE